MINRIQLICASLTTLLLHVKSHNAIQIAYYDLNPYIYEDKNGTMLGIIPEIMKELSLECDIEFNYTLKIDSAKNLSIFMKDIEKMQSNSGDWLWLPLNQHIPKETIKTLNLTTLKILYSGIDILVHKNHFNVFLKVKIGLVKCQHLFLGGFMLSIIFGSLIWFAERWKNKDFSKTYNGIFTGLWFAVVTVTTVGYGDIAPRSAIGKMLSMAWMVCGIVLTAILTSTITNAFEGLDDVVINQKRVVAVDGSSEAWFARGEHFANIESVSSYDHLFYKLIDKEFDYGVVDSIIRRKHQNKIGDLRVAKKLKVYTPGILLKHENNSTSKSIKCVQDARNVAFKTLRKYEVLANEKLDTEPTFNDAFSETPVRVVSIVAGSCIILNLLFDTVVFLRGYMKKTSISVDGNNQIGRNSLSHFSADRQNGNDLRQSKNMASKDENDMNRKIDELSRKIDALREELNKPIKDMLHLLNNSQNAQLQRR